MAESFLSLFLLFPYFVFSVFVAFFIPGIVLLHMIKLSKFHKFTLSIILGVSLWGWQGFIFGLLGIRFASYLYLLFFLFLFVLFYKKKLKKFSLPSFKLKDIDLLLVAILFIGVLLQISILILMGIRVNNGLYFCCGAIGDFLYHLRLTNEIITRIPPFEPDMYGAVVTNYHYLGNIVVAELVRVFRLPLVFTQFQYIGIILSLFFGLTAIVFSQIQGLQKSFTRWLLFFLYFGGDFIYIVILAVRKTFDFSMGPLENGMALLNNPPRAFAIVGFFAGLSLFSLWIKKKNLYVGVLMAIVFSSLVGFKVYLGIFAISGLAAVAVYYFIRKQLQMVLPFFVTLVLSLIIYLPVNSGSGGLHFLGFWRFEEFIVQKALGLSHLELARQIFIQHNNWPRAFVYDIIFMTLFIFSEFGPKLFGVIQTKKSLSYFRYEIHIFLISAILTSSIAGFFFWQQSGGSNSFNFVVSVYIISSVYAALAYSHWIEKLPKKYAITVIVIVCLLTIPRVMYEEYKNIREIILMGGYFISKDDLRAMEFVKANTQPSSIFLVSHHYYQTFISNRPIYLGDFGLLGSHDVDTKKQQEIRRSILEYKDPIHAQKNLINSKIRYLYLYSSEQIISTQSAGFLRPIFRNESVKVFEVLPFSNLMLQ